MVGYDICRPSGVKRDGFEPVVSTRQGLGTAVDRGTVRHTLGPVSEVVSTTSYEKSSTRKRVAHASYSRFHGRISGLVAPVKPAHVLDAGCGEGETLERLRHLMPGRITGIDKNPDHITMASERLPGVDFRVGDVCKTEFGDNTFDLVLCLEVLEHLPDPDAALRELNRVARGSIVVSVPYEPWFRIGFAIGNIFRGQYLARLGDYPGHVQHWNPRTFGALLEKHVEVQDTRTVFPWIIAHCRKRA
jgi:2-polyprenyl-3-methyl-5-hydroxy-6-metoxy-1,4-benzoquinol methylase